MVIKYIADDGASFTDENEYKNYEKELKTAVENAKFTVECMYTDGHKRTYTGLGKDFRLSNFVTKSYAFRIVTGYKNWNRFVTANFPFVDSKVYYCYEIPLISEEQVGKWLGYTISKKIKFFDTVIAEAKSYTEYLTKLHKIL